MLLPPCCALLPSIKMAFALRTNSVMQRSTRCNGLKENVAKLPGIDGIKRVKITGAHTIENMEGKKASVAIYSYLQKVC